MAKSAQIKSSSPVTEAKYIYDKLSERIIGQEEAKKLLSMAVSVHKHNTKLKRKKKSNVLIMGPTASGKTELMRTLAKTLNLPLAIVDSSKLAPTSYKGEDSSSIFKELIAVAGGDVEKAEGGIVFLDEIDKICLSGADDHLKKVQAELLTILEDKKVTLKFGTSPLHEEELLFDTSGVLFVAAGAFAGLALEPKQTGSFGLNVSDAPAATFGEVDLKNALIEFGMMPELLGRFHLITQTKALKVEDFSQLLDNEAIFSLTEYYIQLFSKEGIKLSLSADLKTHLSRQALSLGMGVRGLQGLVESRMVDLLFSIEALRGKRVTLTESGYLVDGKEADNTRVFSKALAKTKLSKVLDRDALTLFCTRGEVQSLKKGETLMREGEAPDAVFILVDGSFRAKNSRGLDVVRDELGSCFGEFGFLHGKKRTATLTAESDAKLLRYSNKELSAMIEKNPEIGVKLMMVFSQTAIDRATA